MYKRDSYELIKSRIEEPRKFIQVIVGPRQVGKTTVVKQVLDDCEVPYLFLSADNVPATQGDWIGLNWESARNKMDLQKNTEFLLVIDEIQKINNWSEAVKREWDHDTWNNLNLKVVLLGSSRVMLEKGLSESLAGRFEEIRMTHWTYAEMRDAFGLTFEEYVYYGGYPGAATLLNDPGRWEQYIGSAIVDATLNKDILQNQVVMKPALLRQTFELGAAYSAQELSLSKLIGQLNDAGNTTTLTNYLQLLSDAGLLCGLQKFANDQARKRNSVPKFQVYNNALRNVYSELSLTDAMVRPKEWGRYLESAIGAFLVSQAFAHGYHVYYWREGNDEVDYVIQHKGKVVAIEVKGNAERTTSGMTAFAERFHPNRLILVGKEGIAPEEFLQCNPMELF
ncbi:MAG: ATP-binding protein [Bacteroidales bacterium]|nr:ATP-binding protein [Bacteroidales bacterium]